MLRITKNNKRDNCVWLLSERQRERETERQRERKYKKRRKMLNTTLFRLIQQQKILGNTLL